MLLSSFLLVHQQLHGKDGLHKTHASGESPWCRCHQRGERSTVGHAFIMPSAATEVVPQSSSQSFTVYKGLLPLLFWLGLNQQKCSSCTEEEVFNFSFILLTLQVFYKDLPSNNVMETLCKWEFLRNGVNVNCLSPAKCCCEICQTQQNNDTGRIRWCPVFTDLIGIILCSLDLCQVLTS